MAVTLLNAIETYIGLSTDTKPTGVSIGSKFLEYDTDKTYVTYDGTLWTQIDNVVASRGKQVALLASTTITTDATTNNTAVTDLDPFTLATILLTISAKTMDAGTTLDVYLEYSPDGGTTWDDIAHFSQITSAAMAVGKYVLLLSNAGVAGVVDRVTAIATLAANSVRNISWCDRIRVSTVSNAFAGADTITFKVDGYFQ